MAGTAPVTDSAGCAEAVLSRLQLLVTRKLDGLLQGDYVGLLPGPGVAGASHWRLERRFLPGGGSIESGLRYGLWQNAVRRTLGALDA